MLNLNSDVEKFIKLNSVDINSVMELPENKIFKSKDINPLVYGNSFYKQTVMKNVSIAEILGYNNTSDTDVYSSLTNYFASGADQYRSRSVGMLNYTSSEIVDKLYNSFIEEPISLFEVDKNKYIVGLNGFHRFAILKAHYLNELSKVGSNIEEIQNLKRKYMIPVKVDTLDYFKTYSIFLLKYLYDNIDFFYVYQNNGNDKEVDKIKLLINDNTMIFNDQELLLFMKGILLKHSDDYIAIINECVQYDSFNEYINTYFFDIKELKNNFSGIKI